MKNTPPDNAPSQKHEILRTLRRQRGKWVPVIDLMEASGSLRVGARIYDLRRAGLRIENRCENSGKMRHSSYRLLK